MNLDDYGPQVNVIPNLGWDYLISMRKPIDLVALQTKHGANGIWMLEYYIHRRLQFTFVVRIDVRTKLEHIDSFCEQIVTNHRDIRSDISSLADKIRSGSK